MPTKQEKDDYSAAVVERFDAFVSWAIARWPDQQAPLVTDDFSAGRKELSALLGARLDAAGNGEKTTSTAATASSPSVGPSDASEQYVNMNPAPWP